MNTRLVFQNTIDTVATDGKVDFLVAAHCTLADACHRDVPSLGVPEFLVHGKEVACKQGSLVATGSSADFHLHVLAVLGVLGHKGYLYLFLNLGLQSLVVGKFLACHLLHLGVTLVGEDVLCLGDGVEARNISLACIHDVAQVLVFASQFDKALLVGYHRGVGNQGGHFLKSAHKAFKFL